MTVTLPADGQFGDHDEVNAHLRERTDLDGLDVQLAYDGLSIKLNL
jgi:hypothetical protein